MFKDREFITKNVILFIGLIINIGFLFLYYIPSCKILVGDENYYYLFGLSVASGERFPYNFLWPPLYGGFVGLLFSVFGTSIIYVQLTQIGLWLISGILLSEIVKQLTSSRLLVYLSLGLFFLSPELIAFSHYLWPEMLHLSLWIFSLWLIILYPQNRFVTFLAGTAIGLAILTKSLLMPFIPVVLIFSLIINFSFGETKKEIANAALMTGAIILTILPVLLTNQITRGELIIANSSAFNIWVGLNDVGGSDHSRNEIIGREFDEYLAIDADFESKNAIYKKRIGEKLKEQGLVRTFSNQLGKQYFRLFDIQTFFSTQFVGGSRKAYTTESHSLITFLKFYSYITYGFVLTSGVAGMCFIKFKSVQWPHFFMLFILYNLGLYLIMHTIPRYVLQFFPFLIYFASVTSYGIVSRIRKQEAAIEGFEFNRIRVLIAILSSILMGFTMVKSLM